jgi:hypothetical protein
MDFRWNEGNIEHIAEHGVTPEEAEFVVLGAQSPWPERTDNEKMVVWGPGWGGRLLQVVFVTDPDETVFVIHARPLTDADKWRYRRRRRP